jgi:arabinofuranosyltransferase
LINKSGIAWLIALLLLVFHMMLYWDTMVDDAFISFRYSENLAQGAGPVYNPGERVEGVTNMLWVFLLAPASALDWDLGVTARIVGLVFTIGGFLLLTVRSALLNQDHSHLWAGFLFASSAPVVCWATGGLETPLFAFLILFAVLRAFREEDLGKSGWLSGILFALATMTRPEGFLFWGAFVMFRIAESLWGKDRWQFSDWQRILGFLILIVPMIIARWIYYGDIVPNTFYVKTGRGLRGILGGGRYTLEFLGTFGGGALIGVGLLALLDAAKRRWIAYCLGMSAVFAAYVVLLGGADWMALFRYYVPVIPLLLIPIAVGFGLVYRWLQRGSIPGSQHLPGWIKTALIIAVGILIIALNLSVTYIARVRDVKRYGGFDDYHRYLKVVNYLSEHASKDALIAVQNAGTVPFMTRLPTLDMSGLADRHIARTPAKGKLKRRYDPDYVMSRQPDYIEVLTGVDLSEDHPQNPDPGIQALLTRPEFKARYQLVAGLSGPGVALFQRIQPEATPP